MYNETASRVLTSTEVFEPQKASESKRATSSGCSWSWSRFIVWCREHMGTRCGVVVQQTGGVSHPGVSFTR